MTVLNVDLPFGSMLIHLFMNHLQSGYYMSLTVFNAGDELG